MALHSLNHICQTLLTQIYFLLENTSLLCNGVYAYEVLSELDYRLLAGINNVARPELWTILKFHPWGMKMDSNVSAHSLYYENRYSHSFDAVHDDISYLNRKADTELAGRVFAVSHISKIIAAKFLNLPECYLVSAGPSTGIVHPCFPSNVTLSAVKPYYGFEPSFEIATIGRVGKNLSKFSPRFWKVSVVNFDDN